MAATPTTKPKAAKAKSDRRTLDRVPPEEFRALVRDLGLTHREVAEAVGRSPALVGGWLGHTGQMRPSKGGELTRPTNPPLARPRLAEVTRQLRAFAKAKAKGAPVVAAPTPNPKDLNRAAHAGGEQPKPAHVPAALVEKRRREREARKAAQA